MAAIPAACAPHESAASDSDVRGSIAKNDLTVQCPGLVVAQEVNVTQEKNELRSRRLITAGAGEMLHAVVKFRGTFPKDMRLLAADMR